jgi:hypothetical protein
VDGRRVLGFAGAIAVAVVAVTLFQMLRTPHGESDASRHPGAPPSSSRGAGDASGRSDVATESARDAGGVHPKREGLAPDAPADRDESAREPAAALLKIVVTDRVRGGPLAGVVVTPDASDFKPRERAAIRTRNGLAADAKLEFTTDAGGGAMLHWIPGRSLFVAFRPGGRIEDEQSQIVPKLNIDEVRELAVALFAGPDLAFCGVVVERGAGGAAARPVAGAQVDLLDWKKEPTRLATTGPDGRFQFTARSWRNGGLSIAAAGYAPAFSRIETGHESIERAFTIELSKPARLQARVRDAGGAAIPAATIELSVSPTQLAQPHPIPIDAPRIVRTATTDDAGRATLDDLPPGVGLDLAVRAAGCAPIEEYEALHLDAGATVEREFTLGTVARVRGRVVDANGDAVEAALVRMRPRPGHDEDARRHLDDRKIRRAARSSGADGRFEIADVPSGTWWLDLDPGEPQVWAGGEPTRAPSTVKVRGEKHRAASSLLAVEVPAFTKEVEVTLVVTLDLSIRGRVRLVEGGEFYGIEVVAYPVAMPAIDTVTTVPKSDGTFELAPLVDGEWEIVVGIDDESQGYGEPPPRRVKAGATDVEIVLEKSAVAIAGRVVDATTLQPVADAWCSVTNDADRSERARGSGDDGRFEIRFPTGGTFTVRVTTRDGRIGLATNVVVAPGGKSDALEIALAPGAKLKLTVKDPPAGCRFEVRRDGRVVAADEFGTSREVEPTVPPGRLEVRLFRGDDLIATHEVDAKSGATVSCGE